MRGIVGLVGLCAAAAMLAACVGVRPEGVLVPVAPDAMPASYTSVRMLVATSRKPSGDPATLFTGERNPTISLADIEVSIPPNRKVGTVEWPTRLPADPSRHFAVVRAEPLPSIGAARDWLHRHNRSGHVLLFVHGFNNRFEDSVFRFAQIVTDSGADVLPILFTWPSRASIFEYNYDKESTNFSRTPLERGLQMLVDDPTVKDVTVLAHSMGTWLAMESLRQLAIRRGRVPAKIGSVVLASPDLDVDVFARQWIELGPDKPEFSIFVSRDDRALAVSRVLAGGIDRVGAIDPSAEPYRSKLEGAGIKVFDLTEIRTTGGGTHGKFAESPEIVKLIGQRLVGGQTLTDTPMSMGDGMGMMVQGAATAMGTMAARGVAAPMNMMERKSAPPPVPSGEDIGEILATDPGKQP